MPELPYPRPFAAAIRRRPAARDERRARSERRWRPGFALRLVSRPSECAGLVRTACAAGRAALEAAAAEPEDGLDRALREAALRVDQGPRIQRRSRPRGDAQAR